VISFLVFFTRYYDAPEHHCHAARKKSRSIGSDSHTKNENRQDGGGFLKLKPPLSMSERILEISSQW